MDRVTDARKQYPHVALGVKESHWQHKVSNPQDDRRRRYGNQIDGQALWRCCAAAAWSEQTSVGSMLRSLGEVGSSTSV
jgi:hypothetical protein